VSGLYRSVAGKRERIVPETGIRLQRSFDVDGFIQRFHEDFGNSKIGAALFDSNRRVLALNNTLAEMNRKPVDAHTNKTLGQIVNEKCCEASSIIPKVFETGQLTHTEITARLATRQDKATWSVSFIPIKDVESRVVMVLALVVETSHQKELADTLRTLMKNLSQVRDRVSFAFVKSQTHQGVVDPLLLARAAELAEECVQALTRFASYSSEDFSETQETESNQPTLPFAEQAGSDPSPAELPRTESIQHELSDREKDLLRLIATGKSTKEISTILVLTEATVETYRSRLYDKLGIHNVADITRFAIRMKLASP
jgi:DNA-binding CsgD family transcriptional regulator